MSVSLEPTVGPTGELLQRCDGDADIDGIGLRKAAWWAPRLWPLWRYGNRRGANKPTPHAEGDRSYRRRRTTTPFTIDMVLTGAFDPDDVPAADEWAQFWLNHDYIIENIVADPGTLRGTRSMTLLAPDSTTLTANVTVLDFVLGNVENARALASLTIEIPRGGFTG